MITTNKTTDSGCASTTTTANSSGSYTYNGIFNYCLKRMPCGRCELTGKKCNEESYIYWEKHPCPPRPWWEPYWTRPWWEPYWTAGPIGNDFNTVPTECTLNNTKKE